MSAVIFLGVVSHWVLDYFTHRPDRPKVGLGLWNSVPATMIVEAAIYALLMWLIIIWAYFADRNTFESSIVS